MWARASVARTSKKLEDLDPDLEGLLTQEFFQVLEEPPASSACPPETAEIDQKMHETAKIILKPLDEDGGAILLMVSKHRHLGEATVC